MPSRGIGSQSGRSVFDETAECNEQHVANAMARLIDRRRAKVPVASMGFSMQDRLEAQPAAPGMGAAVDHGGAHEVAAPSQLQAGGAAVQAADDECGVAQCGQAHAVDQGLGAGESPSTDNVLRNLGELGVWA